MKFEKYQKLTHQFAVYPENKAFEYLVLGLISEIGEVVGVVKKHIRGDEFNYQERLIAELGDVAWYLAELGNFMELEMDNAFTSFEEPITVTIKPLTDHLYYLIRPANYLLMQVDESKSLKYYKECFHEELYDVCDEYHQVIECLGLNIPEILDANIAKLSARKEANTIRGYGDER